MADASWTRGAASDGWGPSTSVRSASADAAAPAKPSQPTRTPRTERPSTRGSRSARSGHAADRSYARSGDPAWESAFYPRSASRDAASSRAQAPAVAERGTSAWVALGILIGVTVLGLVVDSFRGEQLGTAFDIGIIAGSALAILAVRRSSMFPVVVAPPIVYSLGAGISLYMRSGGLHDRGVLIDAATNWLVYGFPAIAAASAVVLIIAGIRLITRR